MKNCMPVVCVLDENIKIQRHECNANYWDLYVEEIMDEIGITADIIYGEKELLSSLKQRNCILCTDMEFSTTAEIEISKWVEAGGILIGFKTKGLDELFGVKGISELKQADDEFTINGYISITEFGKRYLPIKEAYAFTLPVISDIRKISAANTEVIGEMLNPTSHFLFGGSSSYSAISVRALGKGFCNYFAYNFSQTICVIHQGRPVDRDWDNDGMYRSGDGIALTSAHDLSLPYADYHLNILQEMMDAACIPSKHYLPPKNNEISDLLLHYGGDDEADPSNVQTVAMNWMKSRNLPYHFNIMPKKELSGFEVSKALYKEIQDNGQECSIHFNFVKVREFYTQKELNEQLDLYEEYFGETPVVSVNHCMMHTGWTEQARWASARGIKGDQGRAHTRLMPDGNPINVLGVAFGTTYPHFVYDDYEHENKRLPYVYIPVVFYEARVRLKEDHEKDVDRMRTILQRAIDNAWTMAMFFHPVYIARYPECNEAIDQILKFIEDTKCRAIHMGTDAICNWWFSRSESKVFVEEQNTSQLKLKVVAQGDDGLILRVPKCGGYTSCFVDGMITAFEMRTVSGRDCLLAVVPRGEHEVVFR